MIQLLSLPLSLKGPFTMLASSLRANRVSVRITYLAPLCFERLRDFSRQFQPRVDREKRTE